MTQEEAIQKIKDATIPRDPEVTHSEADDILLEFLKTNGFEQVAQAWEDACGECGGFYYA